LRGRLLDPEGRPAASVKAYVASLTVEGPPPRTVHFADPDKKDADFQEEVTTDAEGAFEVRGSPGCEVQMIVRDERFAPQWVLLKATKGARTETGPVRLAPRRTLDGTVVDVDTGQPLAGVGVSALSNSKAVGATPRRAEARTDGEGRFRLSPFPGDSVTLLTNAPEAEPYLVGQHHIDKWTDDNPRQVKIALVRGAVLRGRVTEKESGRPVARATVSFRPRTVGHPVLKRRAGMPTAIGWWLSDTVTDADGRYRAVVLPGPGHLLVKGPTPDYIPEETTEGLLSEGKPGDAPSYPDALIPLDLAEGAGPLDLAVQLRRGVTLRGRVVDSDGKPVARGLMLCPSLVPGEGFTYSQTVEAVTDGRFELPGRDPDRAGPVFFYDPQRKEGTRVELSGSGEPTVRLAPCRTAKVRFVDGDGKPASGTPVELDLVVHPRGAPPGASWYVLQSGYAVPAPTLAGPRCATAGPGRGEMTFTGLIPGATYLIMADEGKGLVVKKEFTVKPGEDPRLDGVVVRPRAKK
jgi:protocatechuate 3,4-dioxygenase beta subunit